MKNLIRHGKIGGTMSLISVREKEKERLKKSKMLILYVFGK